MAWLRTQPDLRDLVTACYFDDPLLDAARRFRAGAEWQATRLFLPPAPARVLDLGAGRGIASYALAADGWIVTSIEPDPSRLVGAGAIRALSEEAGLAIDVIEARGEALPFAAASFDAVLCRQALHHAADLGALCVEIGRVLRPGGRAVATREHVISNRRQLGAMLRAHPLHHLYGGENAFTLAAYKAALRDAGLVIRKCLNPMQSNINLFPRSRDEVRGAIARRMGIGVTMIPDLCVSALGALDATPGRLYSFVADKP